MAVVQAQARDWGRGGTYEALVFGQEDGDTGIDLADGQRDEHCVGGGGVRFVFGRRLLASEAHHTDTVVCFAEALVVSINTRQHPSPFPSHLHLLHTIIQNMAHSAAQDALWRPKRHTSSSFPLTQLPLELQLLILSKCDVLSLRRLLRVSIRLRDLFLLYPDTCLLDCLEQTPEPTRDYLAASWTLHNTGNDEFDAAYVLTQLQLGRSVGDILAGPQALVIYQDPLRVLDDLAELYEEVETAIDPCAQGLNAAMDNLFNPYARVMPIAISSTERTRFEDALWILKLYYQLHLKFLHHGQQHELRLAFMASLLPWQVHRAVSLETFFGNLLEEHPVTLRSVVGNEEVTWAKISAKSTYFGNYIQATGWFASLVESIPVAFSPASRQFLDITPIPSAPWRLLSSEDEFTSHRPLSSGTPPLRSFGWLFVEYIMSNNRGLSSQPILFFRETGFLFWDRARLSTWDIIDPTKFRSVLKAFREHRSRGRERLGESAAQSEWKKAKSIARWTSCPIQCSFEEWSSQAQALSSYQREQ